MNQSSKESKSGKESRWEGLEEEIEQWIRQGINFNTHNISAEIIVPHIRQTVFEAVLKEIKEMAESPINVTFSDETHATFIPRVLHFKDIKNLLSGKGEGER